ncbi:MAG: alpha/beta fold hydrolase [Clostridia bacterium]
MRFYSFGNEDNPVLFLLPGTCCHWKRNFGSVIPFLQQDFHVVCVSYDGFDETEPAVFPDMLTEAAKIEAYIQENFGGQIRAAYGCSMGGSFVGLLLQRGNIHIGHGILGSSDLDQSGGLSARLQARLDFRCAPWRVPKGQVAGLDAKAAGKEDAGRTGIYGSDAGVVWSRHGGHGVCSEEKHLQSVLLRSGDAAAGDTIFCPGHCRAYLYAVKMGGQAGALPPAFQEIRTSAATICSMKSCWPAILRDGLMKCATAVK